MAGDAPGAARFGGIGSDVGKNFPTFDGVHPALEICMIDRKREIGFDFALAGLVRGMLEPVAGFRKCQANSAEKARERRRTCTAPQPGACSHKCCVATGHAVDDAVAFVKWQCQFHVRFLYGLPGLVT